MALKNIGGTILERLSNKSKIRSFSIYRFILNTLYYTLSCQFNRLNSINFEAITLRFDSGVEIYFRRKDICYDDDLISNNRVFLNLRNYFSDEDIERLVDVARNTRSISRIRQLMLQRYDISKYRNSVGQLVSSIMRLAESDMELFNSKTHELKGLIRENLKEEILYFPTYRRIEEDLQRLGFGDIEIPDEDNKLIQFGMTDVTNKFNQITDVIKNSAGEWFAKVTGEMLTQLVDGIKVTDKMRESIQSKKLSKLCWIG